MIVIVVVVVVVCGVRIKNGSNLCFILPISYAVLRFYGFCFLSFLMQNPKIIEEFNRCME